MMMLQAVSQGPGTAVACHATPRHAKLASRRVRTVSRVQSSATLLNRPPPLPYELGPESAAKIYACKNSV